MLCGLLETWSLVQNKALVLSQLAVLTILVSSPRARSRCTRECAALNSRVSAAAHETSALREELDGMRAELTCMRLELRLTREQLDWWPRPLTK